MRGLQWGGRSPEDRECESAAYEAADIVDRLIAVAPANDPAPQMVRQGRMGVIFNFGGMDDES